MMISEKDKRKIRNIAKKYKAGKVILFGSGCDPTAVSNDIDLAVEGVPDAQFFKFYSELIFSLSKPVDIFDLRKKQKFRDVILAEGLILYG
ncbi:MAG: nucleotidyltransferase domain-containing protein [Candidatus Electrothrix sp. Rat3]|nr:nucleotidyltransferase domain-containing protein [Candidatus Electrothrix rattekaaiensis]